LANFGDRLDAQRGHQQRVLLRGGADDAGLDVLDARAAAVDRDDQHVPSLADGLQRLIGAGGGRLVDGVDDVDAGVLLEKVLHGLAAAFLVAVGDVVADDARIVLVADLVGVLRSMPKPFMKPWSRSTSTVGWTG
jgi:hypothetical protein